MSQDLRTVINDCEANTGWSGDDTASVVSDAGSFYEGSSSLSTQFSDGDEHMYTTQDSVGMGTFNLDWSDSTLYMLIKDNLGEGFSTGGVQLVIGDGTNRVGYDVGGNDAPGLLLPEYFQCYKLDVSVIVSTPGNFTAFAGSEASLSQTACTQIGYGANHLAKAVGSVDNAFMDCFRYIANGSYALRINGGTSGTPETMADVQGDDVTSGWGMVGNPIGEQYWFFAPTEWGEPSANADSYFEASNEQWYWLGNNGGGHAIGAGNFLFRLVSNATDTQSWVITNVVIVNTGTGADFDASDTNFDVVEIDGCSMVGLATFSAPSSGGTSRFCTNTIFSQCGQVTHNGASMNGCSFLTSTVSADTGALFYDESADPDGEADNLSFTKGVNAHHAIEFGTSAPTTMTLRGMTTSGFNASDGQNDSTFSFPDTGSDVTWTLNVVGGSGNFSYKKARAGDDVDIVIDPVTTLIIVRDENAALYQGARVLVEASDGASDLPFEDSVSITQTSGTATVSHTAHGMSTNHYAIIRGAAESGYNGIKQITVTGTDEYTYSCDSGLSSPATGSPEATGVAAYGLTDANGEVSGSRSFSGDQNVKGVVRKASSSPIYKDFPFTETIDSVNGLTVRIQLTRDD